MRPDTPGGPAPSARDHAARSGTVFANGVELWYDATGDPAAVAVLLIHTLGLQSCSWGPEILTPLLDAGYQVIRVDNRDDGRSEWIDYSCNPYDVRDMATDMECLLDALGVGAAHLVGFAMGAMIAQQVAVDHPERVLSLSAHAGMTEIDLSRMESRALDVFGTMLNAPTPGARDPIEWGLKALRSMAGRGYAFDEAWWRHVLETCGHRYNFRNAHAVAMTRTPSQFDALSRCTVPTLFVHADDDPLYPHARVRALAAQMPSARLHTLEGAGRDLNPAIIADVVPQVLAHITAVDRSRAGTSVA